jgi:polygalacturonase
VGGFLGRDGRGGMLQTYAAQGLRWVVDYDCQRPRNLVVYESDTILLQDFTSRESGFWNLHLCYSRRLRVQNLTIANSAAPAPTELTWTHANRSLLKDVPSPAMMTISA